jgi:hypothetical protein
MRFILSAAAIAAGICGAALAQTSPPPASQADTKAEAADAFASCVSQWEKSTHMSKREWERACRRVANRLQNLTVK